MAGLAAVEDAGGKLWRDQQGMWILPRGKPLQPRNAWLEFVDRRESDLAIIEFEIQMAEWLIRGLLRRQPS